MIRGAAPWVSQYCLYIHTGDIKSAYLSGVSDKRGGSMGITVLLIHLHRDIRNVHMSGVSDKRGGNMGITFTQGT